MSKGISASRLEAWKKRTLPGRKTWERNDDLGDTAESFPYFACYRDLKMRTLERARYALDERASRPGGVMPSMAQMREWHDANLWGKRVADYDAYMDSIVQEEKEIAARAGGKEIGERHAALANTMTETAEAMAAKSAEYHRSSEEVPKASDLVKVVDAAIKLGRLVHGETTEEVHTHVEVDTSSMSPALLMEIARAKVKK